MTLIADWMRDHGISGDLAGRLKGEGILRADGDTLYARYERADGSTFERHRTFPDGVWKQPKAGGPDDPDGVEGLALALWWPLGRALGGYVLLDEGEGDTLCAATILDQTDHAGLNGLCPVGLPGMSMNADRVADQLAEAKVTLAFICLDGGEKERERTGKIVTALTRRAISAVPVYLPGRSDLSEHLGWNTDGDPAESVLANLLADAEIQAGERRREIEMGDINAKLGRAA